MPTKPNDAAEEHAEIGSLMRRAMDGVVRGYATRIAFAIDRLQATEGRDRMIPVEELAERLSKILGSHIDRKQLLSLAQEEPEDRATLEAVARMLEVDVEWLAAKM